MADSQLSYWIRQSQLDQTAFALGRLPKMYETLQKHVPVCRGGVIVEEMILTVNDKNTAFVEHCRELNRGGGKANMQTAKEAHNDCGEFNVQRGPAFFCSKSGWDMDGGRKERREEPQQHKGSVLIVGLSM